MSFHFQKLPKLVNLRGKTLHNGWYRVLDIKLKTDIAIHHSLTKQGSSAAFANHHVLVNKWPEVAYHFVILKDGTIEWNHDLGVLSYHVGNSNKFAVGICLVGDFRTEEPTEEQKKSLYLLNEALKKDLPNYKRTRGHDEFPGYSWKACPEFDYRAVITGSGFDCDTRLATKDSTRIYWGDSILRKGQIGRINILKRINLWKRDEDNKLTFVRILQPGEVYRVYGYDEKHGGQYSVGSGYWITKMDGYVKYETPSKAMLQKAAEFYK